MLVWEEVMQMLRGETVACWYALMNSLSPIDVVKMNGWSSKSTSEKRLKGWWTCWTWLVLADGLQVWVFHKLLLICWDCHHRQPQTKVPKRENIQWGGKYFAHVRGQSWMDGPVRDQWKNLQEPKEPLVEPKVCRIASPHSHHLLRET